MKRVAVLLAVMTVAACAQQGTEAKQQLGQATLNSSIDVPDLPITNSDLYCSGFVSPNLLPRNRFVAGGMETPIESRFSTGQFIYLRGGGYTSGTRVSIVRELRDPNANIPFPATHSMLARAGQLYADIGYARVLKRRGAAIAIAQVEFACDTVVPGDLIVPFVAKSAIPSRARSRMDRFPAEQARLTGRIIAARDFDQYPAAGQMVYLNIGAHSGIQPGDYFRVVRDYDTSSMDPTDTAVLSAPMYDDTQKYPPSLPNSKLGELPRRLLGEAIVLSTQTDTATAMLTFTLEAVQVGDMVELEEQQRK